MFKLKENPTCLDFEHGGRVYKIEVTEHKFVVEDIGEGSVSGGSFTIYRHKARHVCGATGFGTCSGCIEYNRRSDILHAAQKYIQEVFIVELSADKLQRSIRIATERKIAQERIEEEERVRKLKTEAVKALPKYLEEICIPQILKAMKDKQKRNVEVYVGERNNTTKFLAELAGCTLTESGLKVEVENKQDDAESFSAGWGVTTVLKVCW